MDSFQSNKRVGFLSRRIVTRVLASLTCLVVLIAGASFVSLYAFNDLRRGLSDFTDNDLPKVVAGAKLNQISANLASFAPTLLSTNSKGTRQAVLLRVADQEAWLEEILVELEQGHSEEEIQRFRRLKGTLVENLEAVAELVRLRAVNSAATKNVLNEIPILNKELFAFNNRLLKAGLSSDPIYQQWNSAFSTALLLIPTAAASDFPLELQKFKSRISSHLQEVKDKSALFPKKYQQGADDLLANLNSLALGGGGIIELKTRAFQLSDLVEGTVGQNKIVADRFVASASSLTRKLQNNILARSAQLDQDAEDRSAFFLLMSLLSSMAAILVFLHINRSVIQRLANLSRTMISHASGQRPPIVSSGDDEITDMTKAFKFFVDVIEKREGELEEAKDIAVRADHAKSRFLAAASHDLRQPLHAIGLFVATLLDRDAHKPAKPVVENIGRSVDHMNDLFEAILDYSQLEAGELVADIHSLSLSPLFKTLETDFAILAKDKGLNFVVKGAEKIVLAEPLMLDRILRNLLSNAVRYTEEGTVKLMAVSSSTGVMISVEDSGRGIPLEKQQQIFQEFYRTGEKSEKGLGLGLAIASQMAGLLGTTVSLESKLGQGATFNFELREGTAADVEKRGTTAQLNPGRENVLAGRTVAILDDDLQIIKAMTGLLERWGCEVIAAQNTLDFDRLLNATERDPLAYVVDYQLGDRQTGLDVLDNLLPIDQRDRGIILTGNTDPEIELLAKEKGYSCFSKPMRPGKLASFLRHLVRQKS